MAYDERTAERVREILLTLRRDVTEKKMMGGLCFMVAGNMCCGVRPAPSSLMIRVGPAAYDKVLSQPHVRPLELGGRRPKGFVVVDPDGYRTDAALQQWVDQALNFVSSGLMKPPKQRKQRRVQV